MAIIQVLHQTNAAQGFGFSLGECNAFVNDHLGVNTCDSLNGNLDDNGAWTNTNVADTPTIAELTVSNC